MEGHEIVRQRLMTVAVLGKDLLRQYILQAVLAVFALVLPHLIPSFWVFTVTEIFILGLYSVSFNLLLGYGGMLSFGHAAYFGIGAYVVALLMKKAGVPMPLAFLVAPFVSAMVAGLFGFFCVRLKGIYFAMLTFAFQMMTYTVIFKWYSFTGGDDGISGVFAPALIGSPIRYYYFAFIITVLGLALLYLIVNSPFGWAIKATRDSPLRTQYVGINITVQRLLTFVLAGFFAGLAGALFAYSKGSVFPDWLYWTASAIPIFMAVLGGIQAFLGPVIGAAVYILLETIITGYTEYWPLIMGIILLFIVMLLPNGLISLVERLPQQWRLIIGQR